MPVAKDTAGVKGVLGCNESGQDVAHRPTMKGRPMHSLTSSRADAPFVASAPSRADDAAPAPRPNSGSHLAPVDGTSLERFVRGPLSEAVLQVLQHDDQAGMTTAAPPTREMLLALTDEATAAAPSITYDDDIQAALFLLYASHYGSLPWLDPEHEWVPSLLEVRVRLERDFERELRAAIPMPLLPAPDPGEVSRALFELASDDSGPSLSKFIARKATKDQVVEALKQRSIYTLREADPHSWAIPRLTGRPKAALVEIQSDEYGGGRPERVHQQLYAAALRQADLSDTYGAYAHEVPAITLASFNMMSMFGINRRLIGAIVGHLAAFEMTSSIPCKLTADGLRRLGFGDDVIEYFDEHVEADAVHEQIAARDLAGTLAEDRPDLLPDIMFGAAACLTVDGWMAQHMLEAWQRGESSLRPREITRGAGQKTGLPSRGHGGSHTNQSRLLDRSIQPIRSSRRSQETTQ